MATNKSSLRKKHVKKILKLAGPFLGGVAIGALLIPYFIKNKFDVSQIQPGWAALAFVVALLGQVVLHEFGHLMAGKLAGMKFYSFRVGFLAVERENDRIKFKRYRNLGYLGLCIMIPRRLDNNRKTLMLYMSGGLIMNLLSGLVCVFLILQGSLDGGFLSYFVHSTAFISLLLFVSNIIPQKNKGNMVTDGQYLWDGLRKTADYQFLCELFALNALSLSSTRPGVFFQPYLHRHQDAENSVFKVNLLVYEYYYFLDRKEKETAFQTITQVEQHLPYYPKAQKKEIQKELLFAYCFLQPDAAKAQEIYPQVQDRLKASQSANSYRIQAAYALFVLQDKKLALNLIQKGQQVLDTSIMKSFIPLERDLLDLLQQTAEAKEIAVIA